MRAKNAENAKLDQARRLIENEDIRAYDVAAELGQQYENVRHMRWFLLTLAERL